MIRDPRALLLIGALLMPAAGAQSPKPVCDIVTEADAVTIIPAVEQKHDFLGPDQCIFTGKGMSLMVSRLSGQEPEQVEGMMQLPKNRARPGDEVKDEPGIGQRAVSERAKGRLVLFVAVGSTVWTFGVDDVYSKDMSEILPRLRELAKKVIGS